MEPSHPLHRLATVVFGAHCTLVPPFSSSTSCSASFLVIRCWPLTPIFYSRHYCCLHLFIFFCLLNILICVFITNLNLSYLQPFTNNFPRADIHELISPDLLHQVIKGTFKDHLVTWIGQYLVATHGEVRANAILDDIDRRYVDYPCINIKVKPNSYLFLQYCCSCSVFRLTAVPRRSGIQTMDGR